jgi:hypothetical protein
MTETAVGSKGWRASYAQRTLRGPYPIKTQCRDRLDCNNRQSITQQPSRLTSSHTPPHYSSITHRLARARRKFANATGGENGNTTRVHQGKPNQTTNQQFEAGQKRKQRAECQQQSLSQDQQPPRRPSTVPPASTLSLNAKQEQTQSCIIIIIIIRVY